MRTVTVRYHQEGTGWWAETDELPTFTAAGATFAEVKHRVASALPELFGEPVELIEDATATGMEFPMAFQVQESTVPNLSVNTTLGHYGTSFRRGPLCVPVGPISQDKVGQTRK